MSKDRTTQGITRAGRGEEQPMDKDRAQRVSGSPAGSGADDRPPQQRKSKDGKGGDAAGKKARPSSDS